MQRWLVVDFSDPYGDYQCPDLDTQLMAEVTASPYEVLPPLNPDPCIDWVEVRLVADKMAYPLKGRDAVLEGGTGAQGESCARISLREKEFRITVLARSTPFEVIRVAESMLR